MAFLTKAQRSSMRSRLKRAVRNALIVSVLLTVLLILDVKNRAQQAMSLSVELDTSVSIAEKSVRWLNIYPESKSVAVVLDASDAPLPAPYSPQLLNALNHVEFAIKRSNGSTALSYSPPSEPLDLHIEEVNPESFHYGGIEFACLWDSPERIRCYLVDDTAEVLRLGFWENLDVHLIGREASLELAGTKVDFEIGHDRRHQTDAWLKLLAPFYAIVFFVLSFAAFGGYYYLFARRSSATISHVNDD